MQTAIERMWHWIRSPGNARQCPLCGWTGRRFVTFQDGAGGRRDAVCPSCHSLERHRFAYCVMRTRLERRQRTLHVAPEAPLVPWLELLSTDYLSIDIEAPAMRKMDLTALELPDNDRTLVWCSHVLEHVPDDRRAMSEMYRVLRPDGLAVIQTPITGSITYEDFTITTPEERLKAFHQTDHVRVYGMDVVDRLRAVGFVVEMHRFTDLPDELIERSSLGSDPMLVCRKRH